MMSQLHVYVVYLFYVVWIYISTEYLVWTAFQIGPKWNAKVGDNSKHYQPISAYPSSVANTFDVITQVTGLAEGKWFRRSLGSSNAWRTHCLMTAWGAATVTPKNEITKKHAISPHVKIMPNPVLTEFRQHTICDHELQLHDGLRILPWPYCPSAPKAQLVTSELPSPMIKGASLYTLRKQQWWFHVVRTKDSTVWRIHQLETIHRKKPRKAENLGYLIIHH